MCGASTVEVVSQLLGSFKIEIAAVNGATADHALHTLIFHCAQGADVIQIGQPTGSDHGNGERLGQLDRGFDVDATEHAIAANVGVNDGFHTVVFKLSLIHI